MALSFESLLVLGPLEIKSHKVSEIVVEVVGLWKVMEATLIWGKSMLCLCS